MKKEVKVTTITSVILIIIVLAIGYAKRQKVILKPEYVKGELLIKYKPSLKAGEITSSLSNIQAEIITQFRGIGIHHVKLPKGMKVKDAIKSLKEDPMVEYVEPNYLIYLDYTPNDPRFGDQWALHNTGATGGAVDADIDAVEAWDIQKGNDSVTIAITDTGIEYDHEDLHSNIWINGGEVPGDGIDNDANGYIDDIHGYDFINNDSDPRDDHDHGTHVAGIIGAITDNNYGIAGVNFHTKMMALKFMNPITCGTFKCGASGSSADAAQAIIYAADNKAMVINASWGSSQASNILENAIAYADSLGVLFVAAAGNDGTDNDSIPHFPSNYGAPPYNLRNVIAVASTDHNDDMSGFSNFGKVSVHLGAPGEDILSTVTDQDFKSMSGTSMAAPHVAGVAGLVWAEFPYLTHYNVKDCILDNVDIIPSLTNNVVTDGRLNAEKALLCPNVVPPDTIHIPDTIHVDLDTVAVHAMGSNPPMEDLTYVGELKIKTNYGFLTFFSYYSLLLIPIILILGWKNIIRKKKE